MAGYIKLHAIGNLGGDPEMRYTADGKAFTSFSLAVNTGYTKRDGEKHESTEWLRCTCWGTLAELASQYLSKGKKAFVVGSMSTRKWQAANGEDRWSVELNVQDLQFLSPQERDGDYQHRDRPAAMQSHQETFDEDQIPF